MNEDSILIQSRPYSINVAYYSGFTKKVECRRWEEEVAAQFRLPANKAIIRKWREFVGKPLCLSLTFEIPEDVFWTKKGEISARSFDLTNVEKLFVDVLFGKHYGILNIDDKHVVTLISRKRPALEYGIRASLHIDGDLK